MVSTSAPSSMATDSSPVATVRSLRKSYPGGIVALDGVDLDLSARSITALTGPNGSGKTTLLRILAGRLAPSSGTVKVLGADPAGDSVSLRRRVSFISQELALDPEMTGAQTLRLFAVLYGVPHRKIAARIDELAQSLELKRHLPMRVQAYSGGLRRRLHLALGLLDDPELLLLDEPTAGLDPAGRAFLWAFLKQLAERSASIAMITHDLDEVARHCHRVAVIGNGKLLACASPQTVVRDHARRMLRVTLATDAPLSDPTLAHLAELPSVKNLRVRGPELSMEIFDEHPAKERILSMLSSGNIDVRSFQVQEPDLASAYFRLTGETAEHQSRRLPGSARGRHTRDGEAAS